jgi:hypothetical protein
MVGPPIAQQKKEYAAIMCGIIHLPVVLLVVARSAISMVPMPVIVANIFLCLTECGLNDRT